LTQLTAELLREAIADDAAAQAMELRGRVLARVNELHARYVLRIAPLPAALVG
jgi:hypothetical protein